MFVLSRFAGYDAVLHRVCLIHLKQLFFYVQSFRQRAIRLKVEALFCQELVKLDAGPPVTLIIFSLQNIAIVKPNSDIVKMQCPEQLSKDIRLLILRSALDLFFVRDNVADDI